MESAVMRKLHAPDWPVRLFQDPSYTDRTAITKSVGRPLGYECVWPPDKFERGLMRLEHGPVGCGRYSAYWFLGSDLAEGMALETGVAHARDRATGCRACQYGSNLRRRRRARRWHNLDSRWHISYGSDRHFPEEARLIALRSMHSGWTAIPSPTGNSVNS